ncbi:MAG: polyprenyl synthetase family protein [Planctomycetota bacterium]|nr:polyprenyl synthetase family protein [Planctomycetota bacterium]MDA1025731.1 polyprenyl synthetase family protein [Planctomycetota bacterium]
MSSPASHPPFVSKVFMEPSFLENIEEGLRAAIESRDLAPAIEEAARYALLGGGKRLRPILTLQSCVAAGGSPADAIPAAVALECIHAFSLVHDDLPALDDDDLRRGRATVHRAFSESVAILVGDSLQCIAAEVALESPRNTNLIAKEVLEATRLMIDGQSYDTGGVFRADVTDEETRLRLIHRLKTGALIRAACRCGALAAEAEEEVTARLDRFGTAVGLMFQIVDDVLDETQTTEHLGKTGGKDQASGKRTFPGIVGLEASRAEITRLAGAARNELNSIGSEADPLRELVEFLALRTN